MNAIGTKLRDPINSGLTPSYRIWFELINGRRRGNREESRELITSFSLSVENVQAGAGTAEPGSRGQILMRKRGQEIFCFQLTTSRIGNNHSRLMYSAENADHTYILKRTDPLEDPRCFGVTCS